MTEQPWRDEETLRRLYIQQDMTIETIADKLGCSGSTIGNWLTRHGIETRNRESQWSEQGLIAAVQLAADWSDEPLRCADYRRWSEGTDRIPSLATITSTHGFEYVCEQAGVRTGKQNQTWTDRELLDALHSCNSPDGTLPQQVYEEWADGRSDAPARKTVTERFGSWESACHEAGLKPGRAQED